MKSAVYVDEARTIDRALDVIVADDEPSDNLLLALAALDADVEMDFTFAGTAKSCCEYSSRGHVREGPRRRRTGYSHAPLQRVGTLEAILAESLRHIPW